MSRILKTVLSFLTVLALLSGCGGGGSEGNSSARIGLNNNSIAVTADPHYSQYIYVDGTYSNIPENASVYIGYEPTENDIVQDVTAYVLSDTELTFEVLLSPSYSLPTGTYNEKLTIYICLDNQCNNQVSGSPMILNIQYTVDKNTTQATLSSSHSALTLVTDNDKEQPQTASFNVNITGASTQEIYISHSYLGSAIQSVNIHNSSNDSQSYEVTFSAPLTLPIGKYEDEITITACHDYACNEPLLGSPLAIPTTYVINGAAGSASFELYNQQALTHNVIDAEFSKTLNAIVIASSQPNNAVHIYEADTGNHYEITLNKAPTALSVTSDNTNIAVGHDAMISYINFNNMLPTASQVTEFFAPDTIYDLVLNQGSIHFTPYRDQWTNLYSLNLATMGITSSVWSIYEKSKIKLHPSGQFAYLMTTNVFPNDIEKFDITSAPATYLYDSPYHGDHNMCGNMWMGLQGERIYTACGNTFTSNSTQSLDMLYSGTLPLIENGSIKSLAEANKTDELMYLEEERYCNPDYEVCKTNVRFANKQYLTNKSLVPLPQIGMMTQRGQFVFYDNNDQRWLISHTETNNTYYLGKLVEKQ